MPLREGGEWEGEGRERERDGEGTGRWGRSLEGVEGGREGGTREESVQRLNASGRPALPPVHVVVAARLADKQTDTRTDSGREPRLAYLVPLCAGRRKETC